MVRSDFATHPAARQRLLECSGIYMQSRHQINAGTSRATRRAFRCASGSSGRGVLFLPYQADQIAALNSVFSNWMRRGLSALPVRVTAHEAAPSNAGPQANASFMGT